MLIKSSHDSWLNPSPIIEPDFVKFPDTGFAEGDNFRQQNLAVAVTGEFDSFFADKPDPRLQSTLKKDAESQDSETAENFQSTDHKQNFTRNNFV